MRYNHFSMLPERAFEKRGFGSRAPATLEGGGGGIISSIGNAVSNVVQGAGNALAGLDKAVAHAIPGGWMTVGGLALTGAAGAFASGALSLGEAVAEGAAAGDLISAGASVPELVSAGASVPELVSAGASVPELISTGASASELMQAGIPVSQLVTNGVGASELLSAGASVPELISAGTPVSGLMNAGVAASDLMSAGVPLTDIVSSGAPLSELASSGISASDLIGAGASTQNLADAGVLESLSGGNLIDSTTGELVSSSGESLAGASNEGLQASDLTGIKADANGNLVQTFDDGSTMTMDQSGNVIGSTEAPPDPNTTLDKIGQKAGDYLKNKVTSTLANKALGALLAPATKALATGVGLKTGTGTTGGLNSLSSASPTTSEVPTLTPTFGGGTTGAPITLQGGTFAQSALPSVYNVPSASAPAASTGNQFEAAAANPSMTPMFAEGGSVGDAHVPEFYSEGGLNNRYVKGDGDGTSDDVPAMLANGEFVIPADVVAALGNGSNDSGSKVLDNFLSVIREHKQKHDSKHLPPDSKGALAYLLSAKNKVGK